jgi:hypothetical protein
MTETTVDVARYADAIRKGDDPEVVIRVALAEAARKRVITDVQVHDAAVAIDPAAWEPGIFYRSDLSGAARDLSLVQARAALEAARDAS